MSRLDGIELRRIDLAFRHAIDTAAGSHRRRPLVLARVVTDESEGWGECAALADGTSVDPDADTVWQALVEGLAPRLLAAARHRGGQVPADAVAGLFGGGGVERMGGAALEMAVLDAELRAAGESLAQRLGASRPTVAVGAVVGIPPGRSVAALVGAVDALVERRFVRVRVKIAPGFDVAPLRALRGPPPTLALQADANGAYRLGSEGPDAAERLGALDALGLACIEQPLAPADLAGHGELARRLETPVALDESLSSVRRVEAALHHRACGVACLKPARLGGVVPARQALARCREAGVPAFLGGFFEAGLGRSANAALAALRGFELPGDLSAPTDYLDDDPFGYQPVGDGWVTVPTGPGIAALPDPACLERHDRARRWLPG